MIDDIGQLMAWEDGALTEEEEAALFQRLVNDGRAWSLQGMYGRRAAQLIKQGKVTQNANRD